MYKLKEIDVLIFFLHNRFVNEVFCCLFTFTNIQGQLHRRVCYSPASRKFVVLGKCFYLTFKTECRSDSLAAFRSSMIFQ